MFLKEIHKSLQIAVTLVNRDVIESLKVPIRESRNVDSFTESPQTAVTRESPGSDPPTP